MNTEVYYKEMSFLNTGGWRFGFDEYPKNDDIRDSVKEKDLLDQERWDN